MFRARDPQESLWQSQFLVTPKKAKRLEGSWAEVFRNEALPLIDEELFAPMYCADNGRPNRAVQTVLGVHLLKEMFNFTDGEALEQLEFNLLWHHALRLDIEETHLPQKTLHNFRVRLMQHDGCTGPSCPTAVVMCGFQRPCRLEAPRRRGAAGLRVLSRRYTFSPARHTYARFQVEVLLPALRTFTHYRLPPAVPELRLPR